MTDSFAESYDEARRKFIAAAWDAKARLHTYARDDLKGARGETLATDIAVIGPDDAERGAIVISGTHGIEGFTGSAVLHRWLATRAGIARGGEVKLILVHAINPWAFSYRSRTTENNVDLNRNFLREWRGRPNPGYDALAKLLRFDVRDAAATLAAWREYRAFLDRHGAHLENEMFEGQSHEPDGLCYAGKAPEWSNNVFRRIVREHLSGARGIGFLDWHTGVGSFGQISHLIFDDVQSPEYAAAASWWAIAPQAKSPYGAGTTPKFRGLLCQAIRQELPDANIAGAVVEFGTADEYEIFRADCLDLWLRFEGRDDPDREHLLADYKNSMCPPDLSWRNLVLREGPAAMDRLIAGVGAWRD